MVTRRVHLDRNLAPGEIDQLVEDLLNGERLATAKIVRFGGLTAFQDPSIAAYDVTHVGEVPARLEVPDTYRGLPFPGLNLRDLTREAGANVKKAPAQDRCG